MGVWRNATIAICTFALVSGCAGSASQTLASKRNVHASQPSDTRPRLEVTATAYNSLHGQGSGDPTLAAWGDRLKPGMKALAVSRDLLELGLTHGAVVEIEGVPGLWTVRDKMNKRWRRRIDLYMGVDRRAALQWGRRPVVIRWIPAER